MTTRRIRLVRSEPVNTNFYYYSVYRMRIEVVEVEGPDVESQVFIYKKKPVNPYSNAPSDTFEAVAGPSQLATIPAGAPDVNQSYPYYRLSYVELDFITNEQAMRVWEEIKSEVCNLVEALGKMTLLEPVEEVWCPDAPSDPSQPSESVSVSESTSESI